MIFSAPAMAAESSLEGYSNNDGSVVQGLEEGGAAPTGANNNGGPRGGQPLEEAQTAGVSGLPFTGRDAGLIAGAGALLALLGFGLRRLTVVRQAT